MKEDKKRERLAALFGLQEHLPTEPTPDQRIEQQTASRDAEAVAAYITQPQRFTRKKCKLESCGKEFATDRGNVAYCSDDCRKEWLAAIGIVWDPKKPPAERWDFKVITNDNGEATPVGSTREPLTVRSEALVVADLAVEMLAAEQQQVVNDNVVPEIPTLSVLPQSEDQQAPTIFVL